MASDINVAIPPLGSPTTAGVRANFSAAKSEIEELQAAHVLRLGSINESSEIFSNALQITSDSQFNSTQKFLTILLGLFRGILLIMKSSFKKLGGTHGNYHFTSCEKLGLD